MGISANMKSGEQKRNMAVNGHESEFLSYAQLIDLGSCRHFSKKKVKRALVPYRIRQEMRSEVVVISNKLKMLSIKKKTIIFVTSRLDHVRVQVSACCVCSLVALLDALKQPPTRCSCFFLLPLIRMKM